MSYEECLQNWGNATLGIKDLSCTNYQYLLKIIFPHENPNQWECGAASQQIEPLFLLMLAKA